MAHGVPGDWSIQLVEYRPSLDKAPEQMAYLVRGGRSVEKVRPVTLVGWWAGPGLWFRSMERRVEIATQRLMAEAARIEEREQRAAQLRWRAQVAARRTQGKR